jgi:hypothetical protein
MKQPTTSTTPDPEMTMPFNKSRKSTEPTACTTGPRDSVQVKQSQQLRGAPRTGDAQPVFMTYCGGEGI